MSKKCFKCGEEKSLDNFSKDKTKKDGYAGKCKQCRKIENQLIYQKLETRVGTRTYTQKEFFDQIDKEHLEKYFYEKTVYSGSQQKLKLNCKIHGEFEILPQQFQKGGGCNICQNSKKYTTQEFINKANQVHNNKFDYSLVEYNNSNEKIKVICPIHGVFTVKPSSHIQGSDCFKCKVKNQFLTNEDFTNRSQLVHKDKYDYSITDYLGIRNKIKIICNKHGEFETWPQIHMNGSNCPQCAIESNQYSSQYELEIINFIKEKLPNINIIQCYRLDNKEIDIYLPDYNLGIEFNGLYWHSHIYKENSYHKVKSDFFEKNNIQIFHIWEDQWLNKKNIIKSMIYNKLNLNTERIYARKCIIKEVDYNTKNNFFINNHIQGDCPSKTNIGLFFNDELVSCMSFGKERFKKQSESHELLRFCNKLNINVIGGASRLFKHFLKNYSPKNIITFADRRFSQGNLYNVLGFKFIEYTSPNYIYWKNFQIFNRIYFQKHKLKDKLEIFDKDKSEYENMVINGYNRVWDCGNYKFEYKKDL